MQGSDSTSPHQASEAAQRSKRLFGNQTGGEHGVAKMLREAREGREEEIPQISERLRIRAAYLRAIEEGRYSDLPGDAYAIGFVRAYANYLGLDGEEAVRRFKKEASVSGKATSLVFPIPAREGRAPKGVVLLLSILLALAIYGVWYAITYRADAPVQPVLLEEETVTTPPSVTEEATPMAEEEMEGEFAGEAVSETPIVSETVDAPAASEEAALPPPTVSPPPPSQVSPSQTPALPTPVVSAEEPVSAMIVLRGKSDTWIEVRDEGGRSIMAGVLRQNEIYRPPSQKGLTLAIGDASGVEILVDGKTVPPLGGSGTVLRNVLLDPARLRAGSAVPE